MLTNIVVSYSCYFPSRFNAFQTLFRKVAKGSIQVTSIDYRATTIAFSGKSYIQVREFFVMNSFKTIPEHLAEMNGSDYSKAEITFSLPIEKLFSFYGDIFTFYFHSQTHP